MAQAEMVVGSDVQRQRDAMHGHSLALAALFAAMPATGTSIPIEFTDSLFDFAINLLTNNTNGTLQITTAQRQAGWNLVAGTVTGLEEPWVSANLPKLFALWEGELAPENAGIKNAGRDTVRFRTCA
eukprot:SAG11_NODE_1478_length_4837_cov_1.608485_3_plen_127_part_00